MLLGIVRGKNVLGRLQKSFIFHKTIVGSSVFLMGHLPSMTWNLLVLTAQRYYSISSPFNTDFARERVKLKMGRFPDHDHPDQER